MTIVAFQGENGAYSQEAIYQAFGPDVETLPCRTFEAVFEAVESGAANYGALPVENSTAGSVTQAYDLLLDRDLKIWQEVHYRVRHCLMVNPGVKMEDVKRVYSHPQALAQCERYLVNRGLEPVAAYDTAGSAKELAADPKPDAAVIASSLAAKIYGLDVLDVNVEDLAFNYTRFFMLGDQEPPRAPQNKTSLVFATRNIPAALYNCLGEFAEKGINLTKLESRPRRNKPWQYVFYLDFDGHWQDPSCRRALVGLLHKSVFVKLLGSYPAAPVPEANGQQADAA
ncbi:MAG: prephenate dehydratase [Chloroflexi bacterium]|nr:prephenate dehydratase [Chloroflexota bacterium]